MSTPETKVDIGTGDHQWSQFVQEVVRGLTHNSCNVSEVKLVVCSLVLRNGELHHRSHE